MVKLNIFVVFWAKVLKKQHIVVTCETFINVNMLKKGNNMETLTLEASEMLKYLQKHDKKSKSDTLNLSSAFHCSWYANYMFSFPQLSCQTLCSQNSKWRNLPKTGLCKRKEQQHKFCLVSQIWFTNPLLHPVYPVFLFSSLPPNSTS